MPNVEEIHGIVGDALRSGRVADAATWHDALLGDAQNPISLTLLACICGEQGDPVSGLAYLGEALRLEPLYSEAHIQRGNLLLRVDEPGLAAEELDGILRYDPFHVQALQSAIHLYQKVGRGHDAIELIKRRIKLGGDSAEIQNSLGLCLHFVGNLQGSLAAYKRAIAISPGNPLYYSNAATIHFHFEQYDEALAHLSRAIAIDPHNAFAWYHTGNVLKSTRKPLQAIDAYRHAIAAKPDYAEAHFALGCALLHLDRWQEGWSEYEWRWKVPGLVAPIYAGVPLWQGEMLRGKSILVVAEQGSGDTLQYVRYVEELVDRGAEVYVWTPIETAALLRRIPSITRAATNRYDLPRCDYFIPIMSIPRLTGATIANIPTKPYITCDPVMLEQFKKELGPRKKQLRIGLSWAGSAQQVEDVHRSAKLSALSPLFAESDIRWISLQKGPPQAQLAESGFAIEDWSEKLHTFDETAALMCALDGVVSVCSAPIHLAGALGVRSVAMLSWAADWRWREDDTATPYYPRMNIARMTSLNNWHEVATRTAEIVSSWKPKVGSRARSEK